MLRFTCQLVVLAMFFVAIQASAESTKVPITLSSNGHILVPLLVNGKGPFRFLIDTGSDRIVLDKTVQEAAKLPSLGAGAMRGAGSGTQGIDMVDRVELSLANGVAPKLTFAHDQPVVMPLAKSLGGAR